MSIADAFFMASFTVPEIIHVDSTSMLWLLPLVAAISIVYKTTKIPKIKVVSFLREVVILFGSIVVFMAVSAIALCVVAWLITE